jgi:hypothetical protein
MSPMATSFGLITRGQTGRQYKLISQYIETFTIAYTRDTGSLQRLYGQPGLPPPKPPDHLQHGWQEDDRPDRDGEKYDDDERGEDRDEGFGDKQMVQALIAEWIYWTRCISDCAADANHGYHMAHPKTWPNRS